MTTEGRWVYARDLQISDVVRSHSFREQKISDLEIFETKTLVYNFFVDDLHNYCVGKNETLVHNTNSPIKGNHTSPKDAANALANKILKDWKNSGVGTGARSGRHGVPYNRAATELEQLAKKMDCQMSIEMHF
jgi:hypothetical protein